MSLLQMKKLRLGQLNRLHKVTELISGKGRMERRLSYSKSIALSTFSIFVDILSPWARRSRI